jgi:hypothetical protein
MQHVIVASVLGIKRKGWGAYRGMGHLILNCLRLIPSFSFDHSILMVPELWGDRPEYGSLVLRLTEVQHGWRYVN